MKYKDNKKHLVILGSYLLYFTLLLLCVGCSQLRGQLFVPLEAPMLWPEPPEQPRIKYIGSISTEDDLKREVSWSESLGQLIFGKGKIGVLLSPYAVATDQNNRLVVADNAGAVVHIFDLNSRKYKQFSDITKEEKLQKPVGLVIINNNIYVVDSGLQKVCIFDRNGKFLSSFGQDRLERPSGIAYFPDKQQIYVADTARHTIDVFTADGKFIYQIGKRGVQAGTFNFPTHLYIDQQGRLYVSDSLNYRVQIFSSEGKFLKAFGMQGDRPGNFAHPCGIAVDTFGNIYVTDRQFENIQIFNREGRILMALGREGSGIGQFWLPAGIFIDKNNRIYVADSFNKRVQIFELLEEPGQ